MKRSDRERIETILAARHPCVAITTEEEADALLLVRDAAMGAKLDLWVWSVLDGVYDGLISEPTTVKETENPAAALYYFASLDKPALCVLLDLAPHLEDARTLRALRDAIEQRRHHGGHIVLIDHESKLPPVVESYSTRFELGLPDEDDLEDIVRRTVKREHKHRPLDVKMSKGVLRSIVRNLVGLSRRQAEQVIMDVIADDRTFDESDLNHVVALKRSLVSTGGLLEYVETPQTLDEVGGLKRLKTWLTQRERAFDDEAIEFGLTPPRGVLMLGVQGAGKSLCAKAIAAAWRRPLLRLDPSVLYDRYVGESERRLRDSLHQAEAMAPIVLWIDEIEKAFASAASRSTDGGLSQRMFGTLLTWMQDHSEPVFLVATANDIEALPPELLRKGRFDEIFFVDLPVPAARKEIFRIHLKKRRRDPKQFDLARLVQVSDGYTGAEIEQAILSALHGAFSNKDDLTTEAIVEAIEGSPPLSVTMREKIAALRQWADGRCIGAD